MSEGKENDPELKKTAKKLAEEIQNMTNYKNLYREIQRLVASPAVRKDDFKNTLIEALTSEGLETEIRNTVFHWKRAQKLTEPNDNVNPYSVDLSYLKKAQIQWERRIQKSLNSMCNELNVPLARIRPTADREELAEKWNELSTCDIDLSQYRPLYAPKDFLEVLFSVRDPAFKKQPNELNWEFSHIQIPVKTLAQLRDVYTELSEGVALLGVNGNIPSCSNYPNFEAERTHLGEKVLQSNHAPIAQEFLKRGSPRELRGRLWSLVLGSVVKENDVEYYQELKGMVLQYDIMVDKLIIKDVQLTASNDDQYFVFEDVLYKTMLSFSRDSEVLAPVTTDKSAGGLVIHAVLQGKPATLENTLVFPPSGVIPFHGFTMYATPFCYLYDDPCAMYFTFRAFYLRYWFRLHTVSSHEQGIVALCLLFERLLQCHEPHLWAHFRNLHIQPIKIVFKWLMRGFSGHLPPEQLLYLWDLVLGYDSLEIIALLAVTILSFRKENLLQVNTMHNIEAVLADLSSLKVMPLLQLSLLKD
ncbi:TBC1 domain family member 19 [Copidosoma floridanum]|uniref:TBC1 domain family member 19 n=1 Tax=Copidosoma floridanum TaxID=29053 RepID=UPI0006C9DD8A|nr:TBC1 domain family member 19 [Copidosoma floridanum]